MLFKLCATRIETHKLCRGGIPVCWPQFNDMGPGTSHGFARNSRFEVASLAGCKAVLRLCSSEDTKREFPHDFELRVAVEITDAQGGTLHQTVRPLFKCHVTALHVRWRKGYARTKVA